MTCRGGPEYVIAMGRVAVDEGQVKAVQGYGSFIPTPAFAPYVYEAVAEREKVNLLTCQPLYNILMFFFLETDSPAGQSGTRRPDYCRPSYNCSSYCGYQWRDFRGHSSIDKRRDPGNSSCWARSSAFYSSADQFRGPKHARHDFLSQRWISK